ncbi:HD domain-containing protein [Cryomyces antarcticus]
MVEQALQTNDPPGPTSGISSQPPSAQTAPWTPHTVLSTLPDIPTPHTSSPLPFLHILSRLKTTKREGWRRFGIAHGESIADHMYRMSILTMLAPASLTSRLNIPRCTQMALVHDMAESLVGDITPVDGVLKAEKSRRETATMSYLCGDLLGKVGGGVAGEEMRAVWQEYEDGETLEARFVHDVDKMELLLQMMEYERAAQGTLDLGEFAWVAKRIELPEVRAWCEELLKERGEFWRGVGRTLGGGQEVDAEKEAQHVEYYGNGNATNGA